LGSVAAVTTCDNRFYSNQLLASWERLWSGSVVSAAFFMLLNSGNFWWAVLTPQSSEVVPSCVNEALKIFNLF